MIVNLSKRLRRGLMATAVASACAPALASAKSWIDGTDFWSVPTNWSPVNPPLPHGLRKR
jgi:hypothetical protein